MMKQKHIFIHNLTDLVNSKPKDIANDREMRYLLE